MGDTMKFLAFDLGAESGRAVLGIIDGETIRLEEIHRFPTRGIMMLGTLQWDLTRIFGEMLTAISLHVQKHGAHLDGIGVDTWGVDFGLVARDGTVLGNPVHYRDKRNEGMMDEAFNIIPREEFYAMTGIQFLPFNTVFQLLSLVRASSPLLDSADSLLMMGDLFAYLLSGVRSCEYTDASTTQLLSPAARVWNEELISRLGLPRHLLKDITPPGTVLGKILPEIAAATGLSRDVPVIAPATHDTASAVAAVPADEESGDWAYLSSGTWSLMGVELDEPHVSSGGLAHNFSNEGGVKGTIRFLKNIIGLWLVQECRRTWNRKGDELTYADLMKEAEGARPFVSLIDVNDPRLIAPADMPEMIRTLCIESGQPVPTTRGVVSRCAFESLALMYRRTLRGMDDILRRKTGRLHIIGGGVHNELLCQLTANACGIPVHAGPVEATALGNIMVQAMAAGAVTSLADARRIISRSLPVKHYTPTDAAAWDALAAGNI